MLNRPPRIVKFGVWVKYEDGTDVMIVNDLPFKFDYQMNAPAMLVGIDDCFTRYQPSPDQHIKVEFDCKESMYVTDGMSFLKMMDPGWEPPRVPKPHKWKVSPFGNHGIDYTAFDVEAETTGHNGPVCEECQDFFCMHCERDRWERIEKGEEDPDKFREDSCPHDWLDDLK